MNTREPVSTLNRVLQGAVVQRDVNHIATGFSIAFWIAAELHALYRNQNQRDRYHRLLQSEL